MFKDWLGVLDSFYSYRLPSIIGAVLYPIYSKFPNWMLAMDLFLAAHTFQANNLVTILILLNRLTAIIMPTKHEKMWRKLLPLLTIFVFCVPILTCWPAFKENGTIELYDPNSTTDRNFAIVEAGDAPYLNTVVLSSWLLLWASGTFRQQLIKDFGIIRFINRANIRVGAVQGPHRAVGPAIGHQLQNRNNQQFSSVVGLRTLETES
uniref:Serpentine receptor class gamma n=1 Tax=Globodera rostochiensis TaxID=31243 RepID=A0A914H9G1_GLORO